LANKGPRTILLVRQGTQEIETRPSFKSFVYWSITMIIKFLFCIFQSQSINSVMCTMMK